MSNQMVQLWNISGTIFIACNCDYGCPCNFNALPTHGKCEGQWTWHVTKGRYGDVQLDDLNFSLFAKWPGAIHQGNGEALIFIDERANERQRQAIATLIKGEAGGPWKILAWTWPTIHGTKFVPYMLRENGVHSRVTGGSSFELELDTIDHSGQYTAVGEFEYSGPPASA